MSAPAPALTLLVPCFNEGVRVQPLLEAVAAWQALHPAVGLELLCVDDGSTDETVERLRQAEARHLVLRVLCLPVNQGKGAALRSGMAAARGEVVLFLDADLAVDLSHVDRTLELMGAGAEVVIGCRNVAGAAVRRRQGWLRRVLGRGYRVLASWMLGLRVSDVTCGFKAFRREAGQAVFEEARCARWGFDAEILYLAQQQGLVIRELPVQWFHDPASAVRIGRDVCGALFELATVRVRHGSARAEAAGEPVAVRSSPEA